MDDRLVAFVGPNEAGKTSVLRGLAWIDALGDDGLPPALASRGSEIADRSDKDKIASAVFRLEDADWAELGHLDYERGRGPHSYTYSRLRDGGRVHEISPRLTRDKGPFASALKALERAPKALEEAVNAGKDAFDEGESEIDPLVLREQVDAILKNPNREAPAADVSTLRSFAEWLSTVATPRGKASYKEAALRIDAVAEVLDVAHPNSAALAILAKRRPRFREFAAPDRDLESELDTEQEDPSRALKRVLKMADTSIDRLREVWVDEGGRDTHLEDCNERLKEVFSKAWSQSDLTVRLKAEQQMLKVQVRVVENGKTYFSTFGERSDGLKAFVALVAFLRALPDSVPPILLIDEAETHLHLDAQADLIQVLQERVQATQVFYTTHSPGCLPLDLGRGLRFVEPTLEHYSSRISHNFWDSRYPGFSAVLFKMGAAAFAFSALRNAALAEGPSDMILLPTLIRVATRRDTLPYQIAPRLNDLDEDEVARHEVAANVVYIVDGDQGGRDKRKNLAKTHRVPRALIVAHAAGYAVEDYVDPALLLKTINDLRTDRRHAITLAGLPEGETIGQRVGKWFEAEKIQQPGKVALATRLANMGTDIKLKSGATSRLQKLHTEIVAALASRAQS